MTISLAHFFNTKRRLSPFLGLRGGIRLASKRQVTPRGHAQSEKSAFMGKGLCSNLALRSIEQSSFRRPV